MTKEAAIQSFFASFGIPAYPDTFFPTDEDNMPDFPYLTYSAPTDSDFERVVVTARVYYRSESWLEVNAKVREISQSVGLARVLPCDNGGMIVRKGTPFSQPYGEPSDNMVRGKVLTFEFLFATVF